MALSKKWQLSAFEYHTDAFIVPILCGIAIGLAQVVLWQIILGVFAWSLVEYSIHRFLFHRRFRRDHWAHHVDTKAYIGISGVYLSAVSLIALLPVYWLRLTSLYSGFMMGYFSYLLLHFIMHRPQLRIYSLIEKLARNHEVHHQKGIEKNFGVTSPLWDFIFRTYVSPKDFSLVQKASEKSTQRVQ